METVEGAGGTDFAKIRCHEEVIQRLRELDWQDFNAERRFWEHFSSNQEELYTRELEEPSSVVLNIQ